jgi:hypothetical protein
MNAVFPEPLEQRRGNVASVGEDLAEHFAGELRYDRPVPVVDITGSKAKSDDFTLVVDGDVELEAEEPAGRAFAALSQTVEYPVRVYSSVVAYIDCGGV